MKLRTPMPGRKSVASIGPHGLPTTVAAKSRLKSPLALGTVTVICGGALIRKIALVAEALLSLRATVIVYAPGGRKVRSAA